MLVHASDDFLQLFGVLLLFQRQLILNLFAFQHESILLNDNNYICDGMYMLLGNRHLLDNENHNSKIKNELTFDNEFMDRSKNLHQV